MSNLKNIYQKLALDKSRSLREQAADLDLLFTMFNTWEIPASSTVYLSVVTPPIADGVGALIGRGLETISGGGIKYSVWIGADSIVYDVSPDPDFVNPASEALWRKVTSAGFGSALKVDEVWIPSAGSVGQKVGSFESSEEVRKQPPNTEIILSLENTTNETVETKLKLTYIEDRYKLWFKPIGGYGGI